ncbi:MAG: ATP-binding protein [Duganella sp.]
MARAPPSKVAILGTASSGKTTLAAALAASYGTVWVPEYLREFVDAEARIPVAADQIHIARTQRAREDAAMAQAVDYLFCDTTPLMTAVYSRHYFGGIDDQLALLADFHSQDYAVTLVTAPDIPWVADGLQRESEQVSVTINAMLMAELDQRGIAYLLVAGDPEERLTQVRRHLAALP